MAPTYRTPAAEQASIHAAVCRARRQGLCCSHCADLLERLQRIARVAVLREVA
jgi:hypothetical protein